MGSLPRAASEPGACSSNVPWDLIYKTEIRNVKLRTARPWLQSVQSQGGMLWDPGPGHCPCRMSRQPDCCSIYFFKSPNSPIKLGISPGSILQMGKLRHRGRS